MNFVRFRVNCHKNWVFTVNHLAILELVSKGESVTQIVSRLNITRQGIAHFLNEAEIAGLVIKERAKPGGRCHRVTITDYGKEFLKSAES